MKKNVGFRDVEIIKDFRGVWMGMGMVKKEDVIEFGGGEGVEGKGIGV